MDPLENWLYRNCKFASDTPELGGPPKPWGVLYAPPNSDGSRKKCENCFMWNEEKKRCTILGPNKEVVATDVCGYHVYGTPMSHYINAAKIDPELAGFIHTENGTACEICEYYQGDKNSGNCLAVKGEDGRPAKVQAKGCCARFNER